MQYEFDFDHTAEVLSFPAERQRARLRREAENIRQRPRDKWNTAFKRAASGRKRRWPGCHGMSRRGSAAPLPSP